MIKIPKSDAPLMTVKNVADQLQSSERTVRRLIDDKKLKVIRIGRSIRVRPNDYQALLTEAANS